MTLEKKLLSAGIIALSAACNPGYSTRATTAIEITEGRNHPYTRMSRVEGEKHLERLAITSDKEEAWLYFGKTSEEKGVWFDTGWKSTLVSVQSDLAFISDLLEENSALAESHQSSFSVTAYHIHPQQALVSGLKASHESWQSWWSIYGVRELSHHFLPIVISTPSVADFDLHIKEKKLIKHFAKNGSLQPSPSIVITPWGKFTYDVTPDFERAYHAQGIDFVQKKHNSAMRAAFSCSTMGCILDAFDDQGMVLKHERIRDPPKFTLDTHKQMQ